MPAFRLGLTLLLLVACTLASFMDDEATQVFLIRQFMGKDQPALLIHPAMRQLPQFHYLNNFNLESDESSRMKRNNAEVVNHILKNYGTIDRLGDVGRR